MRNAIRSSLYAILLGAALLAWGCAMVRMKGTYGVKSMVNEAHFYRQRYLDRCEPYQPADEGVCKEWAPAQRKLDQAEKEAADALFVGGRETLQIARLQTELGNVKGRFGKWATSDK